MQLTLKRKERVGGPEWRHFVLLAMSGAGRAQAVGSGRRGGPPPPHAFAKGMYKLLRRAAAAFSSTKPSGRMEARSLRRTVPVIRFHRRIKRRSMCLERECCCLDGLRYDKEVCVSRGRGGSLPRALRPLDVTVLGGRDGCVRGMRDNWASHCIK